MIILRLGNSEDVAGDVPEEQRSWKIAERMVAEASGEEVETVIRRSRPTPELPTILDGWMRRYEPEIVFLWASAYWLTYESVPLKLERKLGPVGKPLVEVGRKAATSEWLAQRRTYRVFRKGVFRMVGGEAHFTPDEIVERMKECIRLVLRYEHCTLVVQTPLQALNFDANAAGRAQAEERRLWVHRQLRDFCKELHVEYLGYDPPFITSKSGDGFHRDAKSHRIIGELEGRAMVNAWLRMQGQVTAAVPEAAT